MKQKQNLYAALAFAAMAAVGAPGTAAANSTANTTILNVVRVEYTDVAEKNIFKANASAKVTVNLVKTALNPSGAPDGTGAIPGITGLPDVERASGSTLSMLYALTATANGADDYKLSIDKNTVNVNNVDVTYRTLTYNGTEESTTAPPNRVLGSAIPTRVVNANTLEFPGGALAGFEENDIVVVEVGGTKRTFLVTGVNPGQAPVFSNVSDQPHSTLGDYTKPELKGTLTLGAYTNETITLNTTGDTTVGGNGLVPAFTTTGVPALGVPVAEMVLVKVTVTATTDTQDDGSVTYVLTTKDSSNGSLSTITDTVRTFKAPKLTIMKEARNATVGTAFGASATVTGNPQQVLEYRVTVTNTGGQAALVTVKDAVPSYTTLVTHVGSYGAANGTGAPGDLIAQLSSKATTGNTTTVLLTMDGTDSEVQPLADGVKSGYGNATAVVADAPVTFYLGDGSTNAGGGKLPYCSKGSSPTETACTAAGGEWITEYTILYQVRID